MIGMDPLKFLLKPFLGNFRNVNSFVHLIGSRSYDYLLLKSLKNAVILCSSSEVSTVTSYSNRLVWLDGLLIDASG